ncbi:hypothetical protein [Acaryochloris marina]|uniref:Uncharacterized protein n=1 Tax=Acaryochloris marina (strain MBIC 11017) TaxID=329726 RepID=A8ZLD0_ACAM1|nr:hypothetical protein [Acaryochloris marina]ABW31957.1 hypothetical protein AM1_B0238 [Acaryochloris marina MBIC11017]BDM82891.1 hypothetical protein AM10699_57520 [Acaryochloris marina MBIC10699]
MFNLTDVETPILRFGTEFIDPNLLVAVEVYEDTLGDGEASQPATGTKAHTGYIDGVCVAYRSDGTPVSIE